MSNAITTTHNAAALLLSGDLDKHRRSRLEQFIAWQGDTPLHQADLDAYARHLQTREPEAVTRRRGKRTFRHTLQPLKPTAAASHLSTIRKALRDVADDNGYRSYLYSVAPDDASAADKAAFVNEVIEQLRNNVKPGKGKVKVIKKQDREDDEHLRLKPPQADRLLAAPGLDTLLGIRDTAIIALMLCTGLREAEVCQLTRADLRRTYGGELTLMIREGKGAKQRMVPYGELSWCLAYVDKWIALAGIDDGPLFRGFYKGGKKLRPGGLTVDAIQDILSRYPIAIGDDVRTVKPHDLRRTYARVMYDAGMDLVAIQQNLGHADLKTTLGYIGTLDASARRARSAFKPPHMDKLKKMAG